MRAVKFGYIPDSVTKDIIDIKPVMLSDSRMSTRVTLDRVITELFYTADGVVALMEHPTSRDRSVYRVDIAPTGTKEAKKIERYFTMCYTLD